MTMSASLAPPSSGGRGTFSAAAWKICCGQGNGLTFAAKGLAKMGVGCAILSDMKITDDRYTRMTSGYKVLSTKAPSKHQGGIALLWQPEHKGFAVEATQVVTPNLITFQLVTGDKQYYVMGRYLPPQRHGGGGRRRSSGGLGSMPSQLQHHCHGWPQLKPWTPPWQKGGGYCRPAGRNQPSWHVLQIHTLAVHVICGPWSITIDSHEQYISFSLLHYCKTYSVHYFIIT